MNTLVCFEERRLFLPLIEVFRPLILLRSWVCLYFVWSHGAVAVDVGLGALFGCSSLVMSNVSRRLGNLACVTLHRSYGVTFSF